MVLLFIVGFFSASRISPLPAVPCAVRLRGRQRRRAYVRGGRRDHHHRRGDGGRELDGGRARHQPGEARPVPRVVRHHAGRLTDAPREGRRMSLDRAPTCTCCEAVRRWSVRTRLLHHQEIYTGLSLIETREHLPLSLCWDTGMSACSKHRTGKQLSVTLRPGYFYTCRKF